MTGIVFFKAGEEVEQYGSSAIDYVRNEQNNIIGAAIIVGMSQISTAIAGAMAEENDGYDLVSDYMLDQYALSSLTVADLIGITESSLINGWTAPIIEIISIAVGHTSLTRTHQEWQALYNLISDDKKRSCWQKLTNPVLIDVGKANIKMHTAIRLITDEKLQNEVSALELTDYKTDYQKLANGLINDDTGLSAKIYSLMMVEADRWYRAHHAYGSDWDTLPQEIKDALYITYTNIGKGGMEEGYKRNTNDGRLDYEPLPAATKGGGLNHLFNAQDIARAVGSAEYKDITLVDSISTWAAIAKQENDAGIAYREALVKLRAFVVEDGDYVAEVKNRADFSDAYLQDRADMLSWLITLKYSGSPDAFNTFSKPDATSSYLFEDVAGNVKVRLGTTSYSYIGFGDAASNTIIGGSGSDRIYGMNGNDTLSGAGDNDYLEGGKGRDNLFGGSGNDTFFIKGEDEDYDIFIGGDDTDTILGSSGDDTIRIHEFKGENTVEIIDGGGGTHNIIAGTDAADIIDLSGTTLANIHGIYGGSEDDTITGSAGNDSIYGEDGNDILTGGKGNDTLHGGKGNDTYIWNTGDGNDTIVEERDADGKIHGMIKINKGPGIDLIVAGGFIKDKTNNIWNLTTADGSVITLTHNSPWKILIADGSFLELGSDFQDGDYGMRLIETPAPPDGITDPNITGVTVRGDLKPVEFEDDEGDVYNDWDDLGNIIVHDDKSAPGREDELYGSSSNDHLLGNGGDDYLDGDAGNDLLEGGNGEDKIHGDEGNDVLAGGADSDRLFGDEEDDVLFANEQQDAATLIETGEIAVGTGARGDLLDGQDGNDQIFGDAGNDFLTGGIGADALYGGAGDDNIIGDSWIYGALSDWDITRSIEEGDGVTYYTMEYHSVGTRETGSSIHGDDIIFGGTGNDWIFADGGNDYIDAGSDDDVVLGDTGNDIIFGRGGNDRLSGDSAFTPSAEQGDDYLDGGDGDDILHGGGKDDILLGGAGNDYLYGDNTKTPIAIHGNDFLDGGEGDDRLFGGGGDDILLGGAGQDTLKGDSTGKSSDYQGNDYLDGGENDDLLAGGKGNDTLLGGSGNDNLWGDNGDGTGDGQDTLSGGLGNDNLIGESGDDTLYGNEGNDYLLGDNGDNTGNGNDFLSGGAGNDKLVGAGGNDLLYGDDGDDNMQGMTGTDELYGGTGNDQMSGGEEDDLLDGGDGADILFGDGGDDYFTGGTGDDLLNGGGGNDRYAFSSGSGMDRVVDFEGNNTLLFAAHAEIEVTFGTVSTSGEVTYTPNGQDLVIRYGQADVVVVDNGRSGGFGFKIGDMSYNYTAFLNLAPFFQEYGSSSDSITGSDSNDRIYAGDGNDTVYGGGGNDSITGGAGFDYTVRQFLQQLDFLAKNGIIASGLSYGNGSVEHRYEDTLYGGDGNDALSGGRGDDHLYGGQGDDALHGGSDDDFLSGDAGNDVLDGDVGNDELSGGEDDDTLYGGEGHDHLSGEEGSDILYGGSGYDHLSGGTGNDILDAGDGDDSLFGDEGADTLNGGLGNDSISYSNSSSGISINLSTGEAAGGDAEGDTFSNIEEIHATQFSDVLIGNEADNTFIGFSDLGDDWAFQGRDTIKGEEGNDTISALGFLDGGGGNDRLSGSGSLFGGDGNDELYAKSEWSYRTRNDLDGGSGNDSLHGHGGHDFMRGGDGDDILDGGSPGEWGSEPISFDLMEGGAGNDTYLCMTSGTDFINDQQGNNTIHLFSGWGSTIYPTELQFQLISVDLAHLGEMMTYVGNWHNEEENTVLFNYKNELFNSEATDPTRTKDLLIRYGDDVAMVLIGGGNDLGYTFEFGDNGYILTHQEVLQLVPIDTNELPQVEGELTYELQDIRELSGTILAYDPDDDTLIYSIKEEPTHGSLILQEDGNWIYAAREEFVGQDSAIIHIDDGHDEAVPVVLSFNVSVTPPHVENLELQLQEEESLANTLTVVNPVGGHVNFSIEQAAVSGDFNIDNEGNWTYTPMQNFSGRDEVTVRVANIGGTSTFSLEFEVANVNDAPEVNIALLDQTTDEDQPFTLRIPDNTFKDVDTDDTLTFTAGLADGTPLPSWLSFNAISGTFNGTPGNDDVGNTVVKVTATDRAGVGTDSLFNLTVANVNDAPTVAAAEHYDVLGLPVLSSVLKAIDVDGDALQYTLAVAPDHGVLALDNQGKWSYTPENGYYGHDSAEISVSDPFGGETRTNIHFLVNTYIGGNLTLPEKTVESLYLQDVSKTDLNFQKDGDTLIIDVQQKGFIRVQGYFKAPDNGLKHIETEDGSINLGKDSIVNMADWRSIGNGLIHGIRGENLLVSGTAYADTLAGGIADDVLMGFAKEDFIIGLGGDDTIIGGSGNDRLYGHDGDDTLYGDRENDYLAGGAGADYLVGGAGQDQLFGERGDDVLAGGLGNDQLTGGKGRDSFVFDTVLGSLANKDKITDFNPGEDRIELDKGIFTALIKEGLLSPASFKSSPRGKAGDDDDYILYNTTSGALLYDADGSGQGVAVQFAELKRGTALTASDFLVVA